MYERQFVAGLEKVIEERGLKKKAVAEKAGIRADKLSKILNGKNRMFAEEMASICGVLDMTVEEVMEKGVN